MPSADSLTISLLVEVDDKAAQKLLATLATIESKSTEVEKAVGQLGNALTKGLKAGSAEVRKATAEQVASITQGEKRKTDAFERTAEKRLSINKEIKQRVFTEAQDEVRAVADAEDKIAAARASGQKETKQLQQAAAKARADLATREKALAADVFDERIAIAKEGSQELLDLEVQRIDKSIALTKKASAERRKAQTSGEGRPAAAVGEDFAAISESLQSGNIAGAAGFIGQKLNPTLGELGGLAGTAFDLISSGIGVITDFGNKALDIDSQWTILNNTLNISAGEFAILQTELQGIQRPLGVSEKDLALLSKTVGAFSPPEEIAATAESILNLSRIAGEDIGIERIAAGVGRFTQITGDATLAADLLAITTQQLAGVVEGPLDEALTELGTVASKAALTITDTGRAARESAAIFTLMTKSGFEVSEATSAAEEVFLKLNDAVTDPKVREMITKALPEGISALDAGIEEGNVSATKFVEVLADMGDEGVALAASLGGTAGEGLQFLLQNAERTGVAIGDVLGEFEETEGAASRAAAALTPLSKQLDEIKNQRLDDFGTNFGRNFSGAIEDGKASLVGLLDTFATMDFGIFESLLDPIRDLFVDSKVEAEKLFGVFDQANQIAAAVEGVVSPLQDLSKGIAEGAKGAADFKEFTAALNEELPILSEHASGSADQIERIQKNADLSDDEKLIAINKVLTQISQQKGAEAIGALNDALELSSEALSDLNDSLKSSTFEQFGSFFKGVGQALINDSAGAAETFKQAAIDASGDIGAQLGKAEEDLLRLEVAFDNAIAGSQEQIAISVKLNEERTRLSGLLSAEASLIEQSTAQIERQVEMAELSAERTGREFNRREAIVQAMQGAIAAGEIQAGIANEVARNVLEAGEATDDLTGATEKAVSAQTDLVGLTADQGKALDAIGVTRKEGVQDQLTEAQALQAQNAAIITQLQSQLAVVDSILAGNESQEAGLLRIAQIEQNITAQKQSQATIAAGGEAEAVDAITTAELTVDTNLEGFREQLVETIAQLESDNAAIDDHISGLQDSTSSRAGLDKDATDAAEDQLSDRAKLFKQERKALEDQLRAGDISQREFRNKLGELEDEFGDAAVEVERLETATTERTSVEDAATGATLNRIDAENEASAVVKDSADKAAAAFDAVASRSFEAADAQEEADQEAFQLRQELRDQLAGEEADRQAEIASIIDDVLGELADASEEAGRRIAAAVPSVGAPGATAITGQERVAQITGAGTTGEGIIAAFDLEEEQAFAQFARLQSRIDSLGEQRSRTVALLADASEEEQDGIAATVSSIDNLIAALQVQQEQAGDVALEFSTEEQITRNILRELQRASDLREELAQEAQALQVIQADVGAFGDPAAEDESEAEREARFERAKQGAAEVLRASQQRIDIFRGEIEQIIDFFGSPVLRQNFDEVEDELDRIARFDFTDFGTDLEDRVRAFTALEAKLVNLRTQSEEFALLDEDFAGSRDDIVAATEQQLALMERLTTAQEQLNADTAEQQSQLESLNEEFDDLEDFRFDEGASAARSTRINARQKEIAAERTAIEESIELQQQGIRDIVAELETAAPGVQDALAGITDSSEFQGFLEAFQTAIQPEFDNAEVQAFIDDLGNMELAAQGAAAAIEEFGEGSEEAAEGASDAGEESETLVDRLKKVIATLQDVNTIIDSTASFVEAVGDKDATNLDRAAAGAELVQQVGQVLLNSPFQPLQLIGAIMVGGALITKAITTLAGLFKKGFEETVPLAQEQAALEENINERIAARSKLIDLTVAAGNRALDQARELLEAQTDLVNARLRELGITEEISEIDRDNIERRANEASREIKRLNDFQARASRADEEGNKARKSLIDEIGVLTLIDLGVDTSRSKLGQFDDLLDKLESGLIEINGESEKWLGILEDQAALLELQNQVMEERIGLSELLIRLGADESKELEKQTDLRRKALEAALEGAGIALGGKDRTPEELKELLANLSQRGDEQISGPIAELINAWLDAVEAEEQYNDTLGTTAGLTEDLFNLQKRILEQQLELNEITEQQFTADTLKLLQAELKRREDIEDTLVAEEATMTEILKAAIARMDIELEIQRLLQEQNGELSTADALITGIVARRQTMLETFRSLQGRGDLTPEQEAQLQALTTEAVTRLRETGATESEIESFLEGLPQFEQGGFHPDERIVRVHPGEFTLPADMVSALGRPNLQTMIDSSPSNLLNSPEARIVTQTALSRGAAQLAQTLNISAPITINVSGDATREQLVEAGETVGDALIRRVNTGIQSGEINPQR